MFGRIRRYYRDNKAKVWKTIAVIVFIFIAIRFLNYLARINREERQSNIETNTQNTTTTADNTAYLPSEAIISDTNLSEEQTSEEIAIIEEFINKCNENKVEEAYSLLSTDCKEQVFPTIESFYNNYYAKIFTKKMSYDAEAWIAHYDVTYRVEIMEDILSSGKVSGESFEDYFTIVEEDDETLKINLNNFVRATRNG